MLTTIVVPLDGSELSEQALPYALALARPTGASLFFVRAVPAQAWTYEARQKQLEDTQEARNELVDLARHGHEAGLPVDVVVTNADPAWSIVDLAQVQHAELIVMATHGRNAMSRWMYGSVADRVLRLAPIPVLLIPRSAGAGWENRSSFRLLVPLDGSILAEEALGPAAALLGLVTEVVLVRAVDPFSAVLVGAPVATAHYDPVAELEAAREYLADVAARVFPHRRTRIYAAEGNAADVILAAARTHEVQAIAMATHGRGALARAVLGSVAESVLHASDTPLLLIRPAAAVHRHDQVESTANPVDVAPLAVALEADEVEVAIDALDHLLADTVVGTAERSSAKDLRDRFLQLRR